MEEQFGFSILPKDFNMQSDGVKDQTTNLLINRRPALPPKPQLPHVTPAKHKHLYIINVSMHMLACSSVQYSHRALSGAVDSCLHVANKSIHIIVIKQ